MSLATSTGLFLEDDKDWQSTAALSSTVNATLQKSVDAEKMLKMQALSVINKDQAAGPRGFTERKLTPFGT